MTIGIVAVAFLTIRTAGAWDVTMTSTGKLANSDWPLADRMPSRHEESK